MSSENLILLGVSVYLISMLIVGVYAARKTGNADDFAVAGRRLPLWLSAATLMATWIGGGTILGAAGASYEGGFLAVIADPFGAALCFFVVGLFFVRIFRRMRLVTVIQFFEQKYGHIAGTIAALAILSSSLGWASGLLVAFGIILETLTGVPLTVSIIAGSVIVVVYTMLGGMWAVALTDFIQIIIIVLGLLLLAVIVWLNIPDWPALAAQLPEDSFSMIPVEHTSGAWLDYVRAWLIIAVGDVAGQTLMQRALSARDERTAQNSFYLAGIGYLLIGMIPVMLGLVAVVTLPGLSDPEQVIPLLAQEHLPPLIMAIFVGALLAAVMSSADSALLAATTVFVTHLLPWANRDVVEDPARRLWAYRLSIPALALLAMLVALEFQAVYDIIVNANTLILTAVTAPFILGVWWRRANRYGALAAMSTGFLTWLVFWWSGSGVAGDLPGLAVSLIVMIVVSALTQSQCPPEPLRDIDGNIVAADHRLGIMRSR